MLNADGSKTETVTTVYAGGAQKSQSVTATSANGQYRDLDAHRERLWQDHRCGGHLPRTAPRRRRSTATTRATSCATEAVTATSADGRHHRGAPTRTAQNKRALGRDHAEDRGRRRQLQWRSTDSTGKVLDVAEGQPLHRRQRRGRVTVYVGSTKYTATLSLAQENRNRLWPAPVRHPARPRANAGRRAKAGCNITTPRAGWTSPRSPRRSWPREEGVLSRNTACALSNAAFVEQVYQNALGRNATMSELSGWLTALGAKTATQASLAQAVSESAEHIANGNIYQATNSTYNTTGTYTPTTPSIPRLRTPSSRTSTRRRWAARPDPSGLSTYGGNLLGGTQTQTQIASALTTLSEFAAKYGSMTSADFVSQVFANGLGRLPTAAEAAYWTQQLTSGAVSKADLVAAMAQSPDHLETGNQQAGTLVISGAAGTVHATGDILDFTAGASGTVDSGGNTINLGTNAAVTVNSSGETIDAAAGSTIVLAANLSATVNGTGFTVAAATGDNLTASNDTVNIAAGAAVTVGGQGSTINLNDTGEKATASGTWETINVNASSDTAIIASGASVDLIDLTASSTTATVNGGYSTVNASGQGAIVNLVGGANVANLSGVQETVNVSGGSNTVTVTGSNVTVNFAAGVTGAVVNGSGAIVKVATGDAIAMVRMLPLQSAGAAPPLVPSRPIR